jgi:hypothetical protein
VVFGFVIAVIAIVAGLLYRQRLDALRAEERVPPVLSDDLIRKIERDGYIDVEDRLDMDHIREQEERFWEETWDEPED